MNKRLISSIAIVLIIALTASGFLIYNEFSSLQTEIKVLQIQNEELEKQKSDLQNQTNVLGQQNNDMIKQMGNLTKQLALQRQLRIDIVSLWISNRWFAYGGLWVANPFNATIRNNDIVTVSGLTLTVQAFYGLKEESHTFRLNEVDFLEAGEEKVVSGEVVASLGGTGHLTYVATLKAGDAVIDTFTLP
jgi:hypothetical protein